MFVCQFRRIDTYQAEFAPILQMNRVTIVDVFDGNGFRNLSWCTGLRLGWKPAIKKGAGY